MAEQLYPWLEPVWQRLGKLHKTARLPHALLIGGPAGIGKRQLSERLATALLCESPATDFSPCGRCRQCQQVAAATHPDRLIIEREESAREITVAQVRSVVRFVAMKAQYAGRRVVLIQAAERMTTSAANALLKSLEEPSEGAHLVLVSDAPLELLPTIRSRCQQLTCNAAPREAAIGWLRNHLPEADNANLLLALANGAPLAALALADPTLLARRGMLFENLEQLSMDKLDPYSCAEQWLGFDSQPLYTWLYHACSDLVRLRAGATTEQLHNPDQTQRLHHMAERVNLTELGALLARVEQALRLRRTQVNEQLLLENLLMAWSQAWHTAEPRAYQRG